MSTLGLFTILRLIFEAGLLLTLGAMLLWPFRGTRWRGLLPAARVLLVLSLLLPGTMLLLPHESLLRPQATLSGERGTVSKAGEAPRIWVRPTSSDAAVAGSRTRFPVNSLMLLSILGGYALFVAAFGARRLFEARALAIWVREQPLIRRFGNVTVRATSQRRCVPVSARVGFREATVVLPVELLDSPALTRIAIRHELQHHRQRDTHWAYALEAIGCLFFWTPGYRLWVSLLTELQELSCDEALIGRRDISPREYGHCLLRVAELAVGSPALRYGAAAVAAGSSGAFLRRRIEMLFIKREKRWTGAAALAGASLMAVTTLGGAAYAARSAIQDRAFTLAELKSKTIVSEGDIPLVINEKVLRELNRFIGTEDGREQIRQAFVRMQQYRQMIEKKFEAYDIPKELMIVPVVESGYNNDPQPNSVGAAGIWSFIASTARRYDLRVDAMTAPDRVDERLNEEKETVAAARYFRDLHNLFNDWRLALLGYNTGEHRVANLIMELGTRDAWELELRAESKERYLAKITAALLIYKNPGLLE